MKTVCENNNCNGCMACVDICPKNAINIKDSISHYNAQINETKCISCGLCHRVCPNNTNYQLQDPMQWHQGWAKDSIIREHGSSGGVCTALAINFIRQGGYVCGCVFQDGKFKFRIVNTENELLLFSGSKYIKSDASGIYEKVCDVIKTKKKILFIGLPCQVAAMINYAKIRNCEHLLYTVDLICHGTPSPIFLDMFLEQYKVSTKNCANIRFRIKNLYQVNNDSKTYSPIGVCDRYIIAFLAALDYTENCYKCQFAQKRRVSDITLGDSWGSNCSQTEWKKGISLILCQNKKGELLLKSNNLQLQDVDIENAIAHNHQLKEPSKPPKARRAFLENIQMGMSFNKAVKQALPKECFKQDIKGLLLKMNSLKNDLHYRIDIFLNNCSRGY